MYPSIRTLGRGGRISRTSHLTDEWQRRNSVHAQVNFRTKRSIRSMEGAHRLIMITNDGTVSTVGTYQPAFGLQTLGNVSSDSAGSVSGGDTVKLSTTAQVAAMHTNGMSVKQIAASEGLTAEEVDTYLGISTSSTPSGGGAGGGAPAGGSGRGKAASASEASSASQTNGSGASSTATSTTSKSSPPPKAT